MNTLSLKLWMWAVPLASVGLLLGNAHATEKKVGTVRVNKTERLAPGAVAQYCTVLARAQVVRYRFEADKPLHFKIQKEDGEPGAVTVSPVLEHPSVQDLDYVDFKAPTAGRWCWVWSNEGSETVGPTPVRYTLFVAPPKSKRGK